MASPTTSSNPASLLSTCKSYIQNNKVVSVAIGILALAIIGSSYAIAHFWNINPLAKRLIGVPVGCAITMALFTRALRKPYRFIVDLPERVSYTEQLRYGKTLKQLQASFVKKQSSGLFLNDTFPIETDHALYEVKNDGTVLYGTIRGEKFKVYDEVAWHVLQYYLSDGNYIMPEVKVENKQIVLARILK